MTRSRSATFPLVPRRRFSGVAFGDRRSPRRGVGVEVAGTRPYTPGDRVAWIDWAASGRLSAARGSDEFVVRQFFADESPRVAVVCDRSPSLELYGPASPWLDKAAAVEAAVRLIGASAVAARGELAYVDDSAAGTTWIEPGGADRPALIERRRTATAGPGSPESLERALAALLRHSSLFPPGSFLFVLSDFLSPVANRTWVRLRSLRWDVTPVVIQDPVWEQSFPPVGGVGLPFVDAVSHARLEVWLTPGEARERAAANDRRLRETLGHMRALGFDPVVLGTSDGEEIATAFKRWAARRHRLRGLRP
jgi:uncharacterized protein (DUF58 family)